MGEEMKHFSMEKWIDFVNQVANTSEMESMKQHLQQGCKRCAATVSLWGKIRRSAASDANYQPPADAVRVVKSAFAGAVLSGKRKVAASRVAVLFDSFLQPAFAGARSAAAGARQMLYHADPFQIDVQIEAKSGNRVLVTGQLLESNNPAISCYDVRVVLSNMRGNTVHVVTNQFGEFSGDVENCGDLQMTFTAAEHKPVVISLRDALGKVNKEQQ
jgi:hypothetical protein